MMLDLDLVWNNLSHLIRQGSLEQSRKSDSRKMSLADCHIWNVFGNELFEKRIELLSLGEKHNFEMKMYLSKAGDDWKLLWSHKK